MLVYATFHCAYQSGSMNIHASPNNNSPTTTYYYLRNGLHGEPFGIMCPKLWHPIWTKSVYFLLIWENNSIPIIHGLMFVNSSKVKKCLLTKGCGFLFFCCEIKLLLWGARLIVWALIDVPKSCSTCLTTFGAILVLPLITCSTYDRSISLFNIVATSTQTIYIKKMYLSNVVHTSHTHVQNPCYFSMSIPSLKHTTYIILLLFRLCSRHFLY